MGGGGVKTTALFCLVLGLLAGAAPAQNILLKDGKVVPTKGLRRQGDTIMATVEIPAPAAAGEKPAQARTGEVGYPLAQIAKLDFPEPAQLRTVPELIVAGKAPEALVQIEPVVRFYESFRDAPGSWWGEAALLKVEALLALGNFKDADPLIDSLARSVSDPETVRAVKVFVAAGMTRRGEHAKAVAVFEQVMKEATKPQTLATAAVNKGQSHLALKQYEPALLAFLQIPVFYPGQKLLVPQAMLGSAKAYYGLEDLPHAKSTLDELLKDYAAAPQAAEAKRELEKVTKREQALAPPK
jgi:tetratricopeptide (TPR) repeat protein